jgi:hypothetical protein
MSRNLGIAILVVVAGARRPIGIERPPDAQSIRPFTRAHWMDKANQVEVISAARVALLAIHVTASGDRAEAVNAYTIVPDTSILDVHDVIRRLASLPKPTACDGEVRDHVLHISCMPIRDPDQIQEYEVDVRAFEEPGVGFLALMRKDEPNALDRILVVGVQDHEVVEFASLSRWYRDYAQPDHLSIGMRLPTVEERKLAITSVLLLHRNDQR